MPMVDPNWAIVCMLLAFIVGLVGGVRLSIPSKSYYALSGGRTKEVPLSKLIRKDLVLGIISNSSVLPMENDDKGSSVVLSYNNRSVTDARLVIFSVKNSGNVPIYPEDYDKPIEIFFPEGTEILSTEILDTMPTTLKERAKETLRWGKENIQLGPILFNEQSSITLKVLLTHSTGEFEVNARIAGIKQIYPYTF